MMAEVEESKISVWVCREEKLVSGVTRRTSCADLVRVLLEDQRSPALAGSTQSYCIVEKWRGYERVLPNRTKVLRLWTAWGREQQANVRFVLVRSEASLPGAGPRSAEARVVASKESRCADTCETEEITQEKRRRVVRKAFRKLEKIHKTKEETRADEFGGKMETLVHLVLSQDHTVRQQAQRIRELDAEIERHEARVHTDRMRRHGTNYVQDTYLTSVELSDADLLETGCDRVLRAHEQISEQHELMQRLALEIQEELERRWMTAAETHEETPTSESDARLEEERIRTQLDMSSYIGRRVNTELQNLQCELDASLELREARERELGDLLEKLNLCDEDAQFTHELHPPAPPSPSLSPSPPSPPSPPPPPSLQHTERWLEHVRGLSKTNPAGNDDDSDTGLSSMHSQDSDTVGVCESLV